MIILNIFKDVTNVENSYDIKLDIIMITQLEKLLNFY